MKCPCCELVIEDERKQVVHTERCHPELLRKRWNEAGIDKDEIEKRLRYFSRHFPIEDVVDGLTKKGLTVEIMACPHGHTVKIHDGTPGYRVVQGSGETIVAALCLTIDRMENG